MRTLVTGGAGFIGSHLCERLLERGDEVIVYDDLSSGSLDNLAAIRDRITLIEGDVLDLRAHAEAFAGVKRVFHLAALISGHDSLYEPEAYERVNVVGLLRLIEVVRGLDDARVVFASSSTVYGNAGDPIKRETQQAAPLSIYALTKYMGEHTLALYRELYGFDWVALRLFNVYGPRQSPDHPYANVTCKFAHAAATGGGVKLYGDGEQSRDFVHVDDVVTALLTVSDGSRERVYNVGTGEDTSIRRLLEAVKGLAEHDLPVEQHDPWPNDIRQIRADVSRLEDEFGFRPRVSVEEGLAGTVEWFRSRGG